MAVRYPSYPVVVAAVTLILAFVVSACSGPDPTPTPTSRPTATPTPSPTPTATAPSATPTPVGALPLRVLSPQDGVGVEVGAVRVLGYTRVDAVVGLNGRPVPVNADGSFEADVSISDGANFIQVVATDLDGNSASETLAVFFTAPTAGLPFSLLYPVDGQEVSEASVKFAGVTRPDAVVGVNGAPFEPNRLGTFGGTLALNEGPNFIEFVATDVTGNVRFETVTVFFLP